MQADDNSRLTVETAQFMARISGCSPAEAETAQWIDGFLVVQVDHLHEPKPGEQRS